MAVTYFKVSVLSQHLTGGTEKNRKTSVMMADDRAENRTRDLQNAK
jgi:hypothetical protein